MSGALLQRPQGNALAVELFQLSALDVVGRNPSVLTIN